VQRQAGAFRQAAFIDILVLNVARRDADEVDRGLRPASYDRRPRARQKGFVARGCRFHPRRGACGVCIVSQDETTRKDRPPRGFVVSGAPVGTFVKSALLIAGGRALGRRYAGLDFYERVEADLALGIMRSHFHHGYPKGTHCCVACTLAVLPVLEAGAIRYFDGRVLARDVRALIAKRGWRFAKPANAKMVSWALSRPA
jgi:hypothetical protein